MARAYRLTVREQSRVQRHAFASLGEAMDALRTEAEAISRTTDMQTVSAFRTYEPGDRVAARIEISPPGLRGRDAGVDVRGDGSLVAFRNSVFRKPLEPGPDGDVYAAIRAVLEQGR
ncbi:MAG: hypothetical protein ACR2NA_03215 [Solirubrobacterales bacterium]